MPALYLILAALHIVSLVVTGLLWTIIDLVPQSAMRPYFRDIRAVHFGSLYLVPWFLGLAYAFDKLHVPEPHQLAFPLGLGLLVTLSGSGYMFPLPPGVEPFYYWTKGWGLFFSMIGLACSIAGLCWTAAVLIVCALQRSSRQELRGLLFCDK